ncbi:hypothetical protein ACFW1A_00940 [Kitasatospora sp. NPDC058965]|uniref:hypothetical protein n=1 Tax=Kitasatospora sp. NPDC058965 TaxID=3346682 RepID=UPI00368814D4
MTDDDREAAGSKPGGGTGQIATGRRVELRYQLLIAVAKLATVGLLVVGELLGGHWPLR